MKVLFILLLFLISMSAVFMESGVDRSLTWGFLIGIWVQIFILWADEGKKI